MNASDINSGVQRKYCPRAPDSQSLGEPRVAAWTAFTGDLGSWNRRPDGTISTGVSRIENRTKIPGEQLRGISWLTHATQHIPKFTDSRILYEKTTPISVVENQYNYHDPLDGDEYMTAVIRKRTQHMKPAGGSH